MKKLFVITGISGHLGNNIARMLKEKNEKIRGLILERDKGKKQLLPGVEYVVGDVRDIESLRPLFEREEDERIYFIHAASMINILEKVDKTIYDINVGGTKNIVDLCIEYGVEKLVHVSSVHAIPITSPYCVLTEPNYFHQDLVFGAYAKTKAEATNYVMQKAKSELNATVVMPSGIIGVNDYEGNHLMQVIKNYIDGKLPAIVRGGYDFVDVEDVAKAVISASEKGKRARSYILSNRFYSVRNLIEMISSLTGIKKRPPEISVSFVKAFASLYEHHAKLRKTKPLFTKYSMVALLDNSKFDNTRAKLELGFMPKDFYETLKKTIKWLYAENFVNVKSKKVKKTILAIE